MPAPRRVARDESTARFIFQAACGFGLFCVAASLFLGVQGSQAGAGIFLVLALISLAVIYRYARIYFRVRQQRWDRELERPQEALEQLFERARGEQPAAIPEDADGA